MSFEANEYRKDVFENVETGKIRLTGKTFTECEFKGCTFNSTSLVECAFENCIFRSCSFVLANLRGVRLGSVVFEGCKIVGVTFNSDTVNPFLSSFGFMETKFDACYFTDLKLPAIPFRQCIFSEVAFSHCGLKESDFSDSRFQSSVFTKCDLSQANFENTSGFLIDPRENRITKARFSATGIMDLLAPFDLEIL